MVRDTLWLSRVGSFQSFFLPYLGSITTPRTGCFCSALGLMVTEPVIFQEDEDTSPVPKKEISFHETILHFGLQLPQGGAWASSSVRAGGGRSSKLRTFLIVNILILYSFFLVFFLFFFVFGLNLPGTGNRSVTSV